MKYKLLKKIEGINWEVGEVRELVGRGDFSPLDIHNLTLNGTIEKVEVLEKEYRYSDTGKVLGTFVKEQEEVSKPRWRAKEGEVIYFVDTTCEVLYDKENSSYVWINDLYNSGNYFRTKEEAEQVAEQIKKLLRKHHETK